MQVMFNYFSALIEDFITMPKIESLPRACYETFIKFEKPSKYAVHLSIAF